VILVLVAVSFAAVRLRPAARRTPNKETPHVSPTSAGVIPSPPVSSSQQEASTTTDTQTAPAQAASLTVRSQPPGATVSIDDLAVGPAPQQVDNLAPGRHKLKLVPSEKNLYATLIRYLEVEPGRHVDIETPLTEIPSNAPIGSMSSTLEIRRVDAQEVTLNNPRRPGIRIGASFRIYGAAGKRCSVAAFFYAIDQVTPLTPRAESEHFANASGQLSVSDDFQPDADPTDFVDFPLYVPAAVFPTTSFDQVLYRAVFYVDGKAVNQTDLIPVHR